MSLISEGFKIGNIVLAKKYTMTRSEMEALGDAKDYPDVFPIWCTDDDCLYVFYRTNSDGTANIANVNNIIQSDTNVVLYPTVDPKTSVVSWEYKTLVGGDVPQPVTLQGAPGKNAYEIWLELGNNGTEQDFINSLKGDFSSLTDSDIETLKEKLGFNELESTMSSINSLLDEING